MKANHSVQVPVGFSLRVGKSKESFPRFNYVLTHVSGGEIVEGGFSNLESCYAQAERSIKDWQRELSLKEAK